HVFTHRRRDPPSHVVRMRLVADVISAALSHRAARERVRRWERRFAQIIESAMDGVVLLDASGVVRDWTAQAARIFGKDRDEMLGKDLGSVIHADDRAALSSKIGVAVRADSTAQRFELCGIGAGGRLVPIELSMTRLERE